MVASLLKTCLHVQLELAKVDLVYITVPSLAKGATALLLVRIRLKSRVVKEWLDGRMVLFNFTYLDHSRQLGVLSWSLALILGWKNHSKCGILNPSLDLCHHVCTSPSSLNDLFQD